VARTRKLGYGEGTTYQEADGRWRGELRIGEVRRRVSGWTRGEVVEKLDALRAKASAGLPLGDDTRLGPWLDWYVNTVVADKHPNTQSSYRWAIEQAEPLHGKRLRDLTVADIEALLGVLASRRVPKTAQPRLGGRKGPLGKSSLIRVRMTLGAALQEAERRGLIGRNVARLAYIPSTATPPRTRRSLTAEQARNLLKATSGHRDGALVLVAVMLGLRPGEVLGLSWSAVDLKKGTLGVNQSLKRLPDKSLVIGPPKAESYRTIRLPQNVIDALQAHLVHQKKERLAAPVWEDHDLVFPTAIGTPVDPSNLRRTIKSFGEEIGVGGLSPNELRHSAASLLIESGVPIQEVADLFGHKTIRMLASTYRHKVRSVVDVTAGQDRMLLG